MKWAFTLYAFCSFIFKIYIEKKVFYQMAILQSINVSFTWSTTDFIAFISFKTMYEIQHFFVFTKTFFCKIRLSVSRPFSATFLKKLKWKVCRLYWIGKSSPLTCVEVLWIMAVTFLLNNCSLVLRDVNKLIATIASQSRQINASFFHHISKLISTK